MNAIRENKMFVMTFFPSNCSLISQLRVAGMGDALGPPYVGGLSLLAGLR
jgi:hypothetical protein